MEGYREVKVGQARTEMVASRIGQSRTATGDHERGVDPGMEQTLCDLLVLARVATAKRSVGGRSVVAGAGDIAEEEVEGNVGRLPRIGPTVFSGLAAETVAADVGGVVGFVWGRIDCSLVDRGSIARTVSDLPV